ncbi:MAG: hypothetical protein V1685_06965 [Parcubacteria group bacterium]
MRKLLVLVIATFVVFGFTSTAQAFESKSMVRTNGVDAFAAWSSEDEGIFTDSWLEVVETQSGTDVMFFTCDWWVEGEDFFSSCKDGYLFTTDDVFSVDKKLNTATLSVESFELWDWEAGTSEIVTLEATWNGTSDLMRGSVNVIWKFGNLMEKFSDRSTMRDATASASVNGESLGDSMYGGIVQFRTMDMFMVK